MNEEAGEHRKEGLFERWGCGVSSEPSVHPKHVGEVFRRRAVVGLQHIVRALGVRVPRVD